MTALIEVAGLTVDLGGKPVLHDVDLTIEDAEIVTIVGPNGSGKTTLLKAIIGAVRSTAGEIRRRKGLGIGYVPQRLHIDATIPLTARRFLELALPAGRGDLDGVLDETGARGLMNQQMSDLSGGQLQRVMLARALLARPHLLLLDEPTQGLDQPAAAAFYTMVERVRRVHGCAVLMVSHDLHVVMSASDRVICLNGHICCQGTPTVVRSAPEYRALFGQGTGGALALYQHAHDHRHDHDAAPAVDTHD